MTEQILLILITSDKVSSRSMQGFYKTKDAALPQPNLFQADAATCSEWLFHSKQALPSEASGLTRVHSKDSLLDLKAESSTLQLILEYKSKSSDESIIQLNSAWQAPEEK